MNILKFLPLILAFIIFDAHADYIAGEKMGADNDISVTGTTQVCQKIVFITRTTGTLITGLTKAKLKLLSAKKQVFNIALSKHVTSPMTIDFTLTTTTQPGFYTLCITPTVSSSWTKSSPYSNYYFFDFIVNGTAAADHGVFGIFLTNQ